ncbi:MAG TPA: YceI family protein [Phycisphaerales bacterium]|nr:YceI family protein [Phycisphaerales bacterium]
MKLGLKSRWNPRDMSRWSGGAVLAGAVVLGGIGPAGSALAQDRPQPESRPARREVPPAAKLPPVGPMPEGAALSLPVPEEHRKLGTVYWALPGRERQLFFVSDAPVEKMEGQSNAVIGYAVAGPKENPAALRAGKWAVRIDRVTTGIRKRDEHMLGSQWLDAGSHPEVTFSLREVADVRPVPRLSTAAEGTRSYMGTLVGELTMRGVTRPLSVKEATISFVPGVEAGDSGTRGDLMLIRGAFDVTLADYGIENDVIAVRQKIARVLRMELALFHSTVPPKEQPTPSVTPGGPVTPAGPSAPTGPGQPATPADPAKPSR